MAWGGLGLAVLAIAFLLTVAIFFIPWYLIYQKVPGSNAVSRALVAYWLLIFTILTYGLILLVYFKVVLPKATGGGDRRAWESFAIAQPAVWLLGIPSYFWWKATRDPSKRARIAFGTLFGYWGLLLTVAGISSLAGWS